MVVEYDSFHEHVGHKSSLPPKIDVEKFTRHTEAEDIVKKLLAELDMPDVAYMELAVMKSRFACGRCNKKSPMTWNDLVSTVLHLRLTWPNNSVVR